MLSFHNSSTRVSFLVRYGDGLKMGQVSWLIPRFRETHVSFSGLNGKRLVSLTALLVSLAALPVFFVIKQRRAQSRSRSSSESSSSSANEQDRQRFFEVVRFVRNMMLPGLYLETMV
jgi:hypothetical protein